MDCGRRRRVCDFMASKSTVVHFDDFGQGQSKAFFTTPQLLFYRMQSSLEVSECCAGAVGG
jgi:hypothetical protein